MSKRKDENQTAFNTLQEIIRRDAKRDDLPEEPIPKEQKLVYRVEAGRKGGLKGGKVRAENLTAKRRKEIAQDAAKKRWNKSSPPKKS
jgi:hypothetical protein